MYDCWWTPGATADTVFETVQDPDPNKNEKSDPDPNQNGLDPQHRNSSSLLPAVK